MTAESKVIKEKTKKVGRKRNNAKLEEVFQFIAKELKENPEGLSVYEVHRKLTKEQRSKNSYGNVRYFIRKLEKSGRLVTEIKITNNVPKRTIIKVNI
jgi:hypothetical protein|tara:strand:- start:3079 stop:3372 length:294 start_codon:yes stop_codon:yes gene_type:complete